VHPGQYVLLQLLNWPHVAQSVGVPTQDGPALNTIGGVGACKSTVLQQIWFVQSLSD
jgi:hypothetical protein